MSRDPQHDCNEPGEPFVVVLRQAMVVSSEMEIIPLTQWVQRQLAEHNIDEGQPAARLLIPLLFLGGAEHQIIADRLAMQGNTTISIGDLLGEDHPYAVIPLPDDFFMGIDKPPDTLDEDA